MTTCVSSIVSLAKNMSCYCLMSRKSYDPVFAFSLDTMWTLLDFYSFKVLVRVLKLFPENIVKCFNNLWVVFTISSSKTKYFDCRKTISNSVLSSSSFSYQSLKEICRNRSHFHSVKFFYWLDSKGDENITIVSTVPFICYDRRLCKTTLHYTADKVTPIQLISNRKIYILRH